MFDSAAADFECFSVDLQTRAEDLETRVKDTIEQLEQLQAHQKQLEAKNAVLELHYPDSSASMQHVFTLVSSALFKDLQHVCSWDYAHHQCSNQACVHVLFVCKHSPCGVLCQHIDLAAKKCDEM